MRCTAAFAGNRRGPNAQEHLGQRYVVNVDVRNFFPSITHENVYRHLRRELG